MSETDFPSSATTADPLLACLVQLCQLHAIATTRDALTSGLPLDHGRMTPALVKRALARAKMTSRIAKVAMVDIPSELLPCILLLKNDQACVLLDGVPKDDTATVRVLSAELEQAELILPVADLQARYDGYAIYAKPKFIFDQRTPDVGRTRSRHWFWGVLSENTGVYRDIMLAAFLINLFALAMPLFTMNVYDRIVPNRSLETLWVLVVGISILILADLLLRTMRAYFLDWASHRVDVKLSSRIMEQVLGTRLEQRPSSVGSFASNLRAFENVRDFVTSATITTLIDIPFALIFIFVIGWIGLWMVVPVLAGALLMLIYSFVAQVRMQSLAESMFRAGALRNATLIESMVGLETVKALGVEGVMQRKWESSTHFLSQINSKLKLLSSSINHGANAIQQLVSVVLVLLGVYLVIKGEISMGGLIACTMLAGRALAPIGQTAGLFTQYHNASTSLASLEEIMNKPVERPADANFLSRSSFNGEIEFRDVSFQYPGTEIYALRNVSFKIQAGEHVAILGRMGSGKSTLHKLILGLYQPSSGAILIDGIDARQIDPAELRRSIGYVQQDTHLFYGTLRDNIAIAHAGLSDTDVLKAARIAALEEFVNLHPKGFDMLVGERGETLSGGQRQGVGIARGVVHDPAILLLDEPTSAMDHSGEEAIKRHLIEFSQRKTLLVITHRTALFDLASRIIVIDSGKVMADGAKEQVIEALRSGRIGKAV